MIIFNFLAFLLVGSGLAVFWTLCWLGGKFEFDSKVAETIGILLGLVVVFGLDLLYRRSVQCEEGDERYFSPTKGGAVMFLPVWLLAVVALLIVGGVMIFRFLK